MKHPDVDETIAAWVRDCNDKKLKVTRTLITNKALEMFAKHEDAPTASSGWLEKFMRRHHFVLRVPTTICQKPPSDYVQKVIDFVLFVQRHRQEKR